MLPVPVVMYHRNRDLFWFFTSLRPSRRFSSPTPQDTKKMATDIPVSYRDVVLTSQFGLTT